MKHRIVLAFLLGMLAATVAQAYETDTSVLFSGEYLKTRSNQADDAWGGVIRVEQPLYHEFSAALDFQYQGKTHFPSIDDPKGSFGALHGYGPVGSLIFRPELTDRISPYIGGGIGWFFWNFSENPFLQDNHVNVDVKDGIVTRAFAGVDFKLNERWKFNIEYAYFNADIDKESRDDKGVLWNVPGDKDNIGMDIHQLWLGLRYDF